MASHYISLNRGQPGFAFSDYVYGTSSTPAQQIELHVLDGAGLRHINVIHILQAFKRIFENASQTATVGFDVET
jgi:hypothetical protein